MIRMAEPSSLRLRRDDCTLAPGPASEHEVEQHFDHLVASDCSHELAVWALGHAFLLTCERCKPAVAESCALAQPPVDLDIIVWSSRRSPSSAASPAPPTPALART